MRKKARRDSKELCVLLWAIEDADSALIPDQGSQGNPPVEPAEPVLTAGRLHAKPESTAVAPDGRICTPRVQIREIRFAGSLYETIRAFLNHDGGDLLVGFEDDGTVSGIDPDAAKPVAMNIASSLNNPDIMDPPYLLEPTMVDNDGSILLHVSVPQSSRVHRHRKVVYDRGAEGDFKVTSPEAIARMVNRKTGYYSESKVIPGLELHDLAEPTLQRARGFMRSRRECHPWLALDNAGLLRRAGLIQKDAEHGIEGITLAGLMLFGSEEALSRFVPMYKIDCLLRKQRLELYDDRLEICTNLMDA